MNCRECHDKLSLYLDGQLTDEEKMRVEEALERCPDCVEELNALREIVEELGAVEPVQVPTELLQDLKDAFRHEHAVKKQAESRPSFVESLGRWRIAASVAALLFGAWAIYQDQVANEPKVESVLAESEAPSRRSGKETPQIGPRKKNLVFDESRKKDQDEDADSLPREEEKLKSTEDDKFDHGAPESKKVAEPEIGALTEQEQGLKKKIKNIKGAPSSGAVVEGLANRPGVRKYSRFFEALGEETEVAPVPLDDDMVAFLDASDFAADAALSKSPQQDAKAPKDGIKSKSREMPKSTAKTEGLDKGLTSGETWSAPPISKSAFFASGENALQKITKIAHDTGLVFESSSVGALASKGSSKSKETLVTFEVSESQRDELLKRIKSNDQVKLRLFGNSAPMVPTPKKSLQSRARKKAKGTPATGDTAKNKDKRAPETAGNKRPKKDLGKSDRSLTKTKTEKKPAASPTPEKRVRVSFIILGK